MRVLVSFFLSLIIYVGIIFIFISFLFKKQKQQEVLIHTAIIVQDRTIKSNIVTTKKTNIQKINKALSKKTVKKVKNGSKTDIKRGGDVTFKDIFENVKANIPTTPVKLKKNDEISRFKGLKRKIEKDLNQVKLLKVNISYESKSSDITVKKLSKQIKKVSKIWYQISDIAGEYAKINIIKSGKDIKVIILDTNLDLNKQRILINMIKSIKFEGDFNVNILFQTKVNK